MKKIIFILLIVFLVSCVKKEAIYYSYHGVTITRIDKGNKIYFYYGKCENDENSCSESYIKSEYSGLNSGMNAYIVFKPDGKVDIIRIYGMFEKMGLDSLLNLKVYDNITFIDWRNNIQRKYNNIIEVSDTYKIEKERNLENHSNVTAIYP